MSEELFNKNEILLGLADRLVKDDAKDELWLLGELVIGEHPSLQQSFLLLASHIIPVELTVKIEESMFYELILTSEQVWYKGNLHYVMGPEGDGRIKLSRVYGNYRSELAWPKDIDIDGTGFIKNKI